VGELHDVTSWKSRLNSMLTSSVRIVSRLPSGIVTEIFACGFPPGPIPGELFGPSSSLLVGLGDLVDHDGVWDGLVGIDDLAVENVARSSEISSVVIPVPVVVPDDTEAAVLGLADAFAMEAHRTPKHLAHIAGPLKSSPRPM